MSSSSTTSTTSNTSNTLPLGYGKSPNPKEDKEAWMKYVQGVNQGAKSGFTSEKSWTQSKGGRRRHSRKLRKSKRRYR